MIDLNTPDQELHSRISHATDALRNMAITDQNKVLVSLLDSMVAAYTKELIMSIEQPTKREVIRQLMELRRVAAGEQHVTAMI